MAQMDFNERWLETPKKRRVTKEEKAERARVRQAEYKARQAALGRRQKNFLVTDEEAFYLERVLLTMRETGAVPAMMRNKKGQLTPCDV